MTDTLTAWGGWEPAIRDDPFGLFAEARARCPVQRVRLADGHPAWVVLGYAAARQALNDPRISPHATFRVTAEPVTVAGIEIPAHEQVLVCLGSANPDSGRFPEPDALDIARCPATTTSAIAPSATCPSPRSWPP